MNVKKTPTFQTKREQENKREKNDSDSFGTLPISFILQQFNFEYDQVVCAF